MPIVDIARDMQITVDLHGSVILELDEAPALMDHPQFSGGGGRGALSIAEGSPDDHAMLGVALLGQHEHLISGKRRTGESPTGADPRRQYRKPAREDALRLKQNPSRGG